MLSIHSSHPSAQADEGMGSGKPPLIRGDEAPNFCPERRMALLEALFDGLLEYDTSKGGSDYAPPLPAA